MTAALKLANTETTAAFESADISDRHRRVLYIARWLTEGLRPLEIREYIESGEADSDLKEEAKKDDAGAVAVPFKIAGRAIDSHIKEAEELLADAAKHRNPATDIGLSLARLDDLYNRCVKICDFKTAHSIEKTRISMLHLADEVLELGDDANTSTEGGEG